MLQRLPLFAFCSVAAAAAQTTVTVYFPAYSEDGLEASVVGVKDTVTTYALNCPDTAEEDECGMPDGLLLTFGPTTLAYTYTTVFEAEETGQSITASNSLNCRLQLTKDLADCTAVVDQSISGTNSIVTLSTTVTGLTSTPLIVTVTAGADKLGDEASTATSTGSATGASETGESTTKTASGTTTVETASSQTSEASETTLGTTAAESSTPSVTGEQSTTTNSDNAAGPAATLQVLLAGAAALVGGAAVML
ncbi:hypothetical protein B0T10DRAFT_471660 [Thelonectria olida]|uniref:Uncharacterized protein n=1 Tax=Thelonectria olida TaxID=1576542 RepID=A0A9P8WJJ5_9HYPO|nr:hypothetical protein B0T10DRAFT_471660 [Thelonectria olida]